MRVCICTTVHAGDIFPSQAEGAMWRSRLIPLLVSGLTLCVASPAAAATLALAPTADARTVEAQPTTNFGTSTLGTRGGTGQQVQTFLRFVVQGVTGPITAVKLRLYVLEGTSDGPGLYNTDNNTWTEAGINWNNRPHTLGAVASDLGALTVGTTVEMDAKALITGNGSYSVKIWQPSTDAATFDSREGSHPPQLVVTYTAASGPCVGQPDGTTCSDSNACTTGDQCVGGTCQAGGAVNCDDGNSCTADVCNSVTGCSHSNSSVACDLDANACTADQCSGGVCAPGAAKVCNDGDACTIDSCNTSTGACVSTPSGDPACAPPPPTGGVFIAKGATWRYLDNGSNQGTAWRGTGFADSSWKQGAAQLGYGDGDEATVVSYGSNSASKYITTYFRRSFTLTALPSAAATVSLLRDDGAVVYLNGVEVMRSNMPSGTLTYTSLASSAIDDDTYYTASVPVSRFVVGSNVIAVEIHQAAVTSSDISFDLQLSAPVASGPCVGLPDGATCSDNNACTTGDKCLASACQAGTALNCDDGNACTTDACDTVAGCSHANSTAVCDLDGNACTADQCSGGVCAPGAAKVCNDGDVCTTDTCQPSTGVCVFTPSGDPSCAPPPSTGGVFIAKGATWRYLDNGSNQGTAWRGTGFGDRSWKQGAAQLGYGDGDEATVVSYGSNSASKYITTYFRRSFSLTGLPAQAPTLSVLRDDGAVVYVNSVEVMRSNMPSSTVTYTTLASSAVEDNTYVVASVPVSRFVVGTNVVAVEIHQAAANSSDISFDLELATPCMPTETLETKCNGLDDDCDGLTDWLLPLGGNACSTTALGACSHGMAACLDGVRTCLAPPPIAETQNGEDDDCNGVIDDVPQGIAESIAARVTVSPAQWSSSKSIADGVAEALSHVGIPYVAPNTANASSDWSVALSQLGSYSLLVIPGTVESGAVTSAQLTALTAWVQGGGVLVVGRPAGSGLLGLCGISSATTRTDAKTIRIAANAPAMLWLDSLEERDILLSDDPATNPMSIQTYALVGGSNTVAFGTARGVAGNLGSVFLRRSLGSGAIYTLGFDLLRYTSTRCYVNCFDPGRDVYAMLLKAAMREAVRGHYAWAHTVPGFEDGAFLMTHDIDAEDAYSDGDWGGAGALRMAQTEVAHGIFGTYFFTSDYVEGYWKPDVVTQLLAMGMRAGGSHTIQHLDMTNLPVGSCNVTQATYDPANPTLCGEIAVNLQILNALMPSGDRVRAFRAPFLAINTSQYDVLANLHIDYDASLALGDVRTSFPISCAREPAWQFAFNKQPLYMFPMVQEDGLGFVNPDGTFGRTEIQPSNEAQFLTRWKYAALQNLRNNAWNVALIHPSYGIGVGPENLAVKIDSAGRLLDFLATQPVQLGDIDRLGDFWRARDETKLTVTWNPPSGYTGTLQVGAHDAPHYTLEFGDTIGTFSCPGCGPTQVSGHRVQFMQALPAGGRYGFTATP